MAKLMIKNDVVKMPWEADGFFESKKDGFIGACHVYDTEKGSLAVMFKDRHAFILLDENDEPAGLEDYFDAIKECHKQGINVEDYFSEVYVELSDAASVDEDTLAIYGLTPEDGKDILARLQDLWEYWQEYTVDMA